MRISGLLLIGAIAFTPVHEAVHAAATDFDSCQDDLGRLQKAAAEGSEAAGDAHSKMGNYDDCKSDPQMYDLLGDGCRSKRSDYETAASDLESKMDDLDSRLRDVQRSCDYEFSVNRLSAAEASARHLDAANKRLCLSYKNFAPLISRQNILTMCLAQQSADWCKSCLGQ